VTGAEVVFGLVLAVWVAGLWFTRQRAREQALERYGAWRHAATLLGVPGTAVASGMRVQLHASFEGLVVTAEERVHVDPDGSETSVTVEGADLPARVELRREDLASAAEKLLRGSDVETGDEAFDREVLVWGYPPLLLAILDATTREEVRRFMSVGARLAEGRLSFSISRRFAEPHEIDGFVSGLLELARRLRTPEDVAARLAHNATSDPLPAVRLRNLTTLAERFPAREDTVLAMRESLTAESDVLRCFAASHLGAEGRGVLEALARGHTEESIAGRALEALGDSLSFETAAAALDRALARGQWALAAAATAALGSCRDPRATARLLVLLGARDPDLACRAAVALAGRTDPAAQPALLGALQSDNQALRVAAVAALHACGTVAAVAPLRELIAAHTLDVTLRKAALAAVAAIQARAFGASPGQVALADQLAGAVTLATASAPGKLELTPEPDLARDQVVTHRELPGPQPQATEKP
jgi:hypothetical protein